MKAAVSFLKVTYERLVGDEQLQYLKTIVSNKFGNNTIPTAKENKIDFTI